LFRAGKDLADGLIEVGDTDTVRSVINDGEAALRALGVVAGSYHLTPAFHSQVGKRTVVAHFGYEPDIVARYLDPVIFESDPIPDYVMRAGRTMTWKQAIGAQTLSPEQLDFVRTFIGRRMIDGVAVPLFGPNGRDSYSSFTFGREMGADDQPLVTRVIEIAQFQHRKVCWLIERDHKPQLVISKREQEVLYWMARGKSNGDIATILGISSGTVDTFIRRLYAKLDVNDRIAAIFAGMSRGLVKL
jgi:DNA-binding CsgD family transcriptional regulator